MMAETTQVNIRLPTLLIHDLEFVAQNLKVAKSEWLKVKIAELISKERARILEDIDSRYEQGRIDDATYKELSGLAPSSAMQVNRKNYQKLKEKGAIGAQKYISEIAAELRKKEYEEKNK